MVDNRLRDNQFHRLFPIYCSPRGLNRSKQLSLAFTFSMLVKVSRAKTPHPPSIDLFAFLNVIPLCDYVEGSTPPFVERQRSCRHLDFTVLTHFGRIYRRDVK